MVGFLLLVVISFLIMMMSLYVKVNNKFLIYIYVGIVAIIAGVRNLNIPDTSNYMNYYLMLSTNVVDAVRYTPFEPGFVVLSVIIKLAIGNNYQLYFAILTLINLILLFKALRNINTYELNDSSDQSNHNRYVKYAFPLIIYIMTYGYSFNFVTLRSGLAFSLIFLSLSYLFMNKKKSILLYVMSVFVHSSSLLLLCLVPFYLLKIKFTRKSFYAWLLVIPVLIVVGYNNLISHLFFPIISSMGDFGNRFHAYISSDIIINQQGLVIRIVVFIAVGLVLVKNYNGNRLYELILQSFLLGLTILALFMNIAVIGRITEYLISPIFVLPFMCLKAYKKNFVFLIILAIYIMYFVASNMRLIL